MQLRDDLIKTAKKNGWMSDLNKWTDQMVFREDTHNFKEQLNGNKMFGKLSRAKQCNLVINGKGHWTNDSFCESRCRQRSIRLPFLFPWTVFVVGYATYNQVGIFSIPVNAFNDCIVFHIERQYSKTSCKILSQLIVLAYLTASSYRP